MVVNKIKSDVLIIEDWLNFSEDKRCAPAWAFFKKQDGKWSVSFVQNTGKPSYELIYEDNVLACAHMIKFEMEKLRSRR